MPDLPDDLRALLHERAGHAPPAPAPTEAYVRRVERRRAARATAAAAAGSVAVTAVVVAGAAALQPRPDPVRPADPPHPPTETLPGGGYGSCSQGPQESLHITVHATEPRFTNDCYVLSATGNHRTGTYYNPQPVAHDLVVRSEQTGLIVFDGIHSAEREGAEPVEYGIAFAKRLPAGDYAMVCTLYPDTMRARLLVR